LSDQLPEWPKAPSEAANQTRSARRKGAKRVRRRRSALVYLVLGLVAVTIAAWGVIFVAGGGWERSANKAAAGTGEDGSGVSVFVIDPPPADAHAKPTHLAIEAIDVDTDILPYTVEDAKQGSDARNGEPCFADGIIVCVDPPSMDLVYWQVGGQAGVEFGDMPGADARGTVYLHGHAGDQADPPVFSDLPDLKPGDTAEVSTEYGVFVYTVESVRNIPKDDYPWDEEVLKQVPGRLLLVTCFHGEDATMVNGSATDNTVVTLQLSGNHPLGS
jgi:LPXTG-site transpeptidase (sortase) family protein